MLGFGAVPSGLQGGEEAAVSNGRVYPGASCSEMGILRSGGYEPGFLGLLVSKLALTMTPLTRAGARGFEK